MPWKLLPRTFQDAVALLSELDIEYLWVDALCIIQDDQADWRHEATKMASIYSHAYLTIAATSSPNSNGDLFTEFHSYQVPHRALVCPHSPAQDTVEVHEVSREIVAIRDLRSTMPINSFGGLAVPGISYTRHFDPRSSLGGKSN